MKKCSVDQCASTRPHAVLYAKGGEVVAECERLISGDLPGDLPRGGPDLFLLAVAKLAGEQSKLLVTSIGSNDKTGHHPLGNAVEYGARPGGISMWRRRSRYALVLLRVISDAIRFGPDLILAGVEGPFAAAYWFASKLLRARLVVLVHVAPAQPSLSRFTKMLNRFVAVRADAVVVHGPYLRDCVTDLGVEPRRVVEFDTCADVPDLQGMRRDCDASPGPVFLFAGRVEEEKGVFDLLEAFAIYRQGQAGRLIFYGEGSALSQLRELIAQHPYGTDIEVRGKATQHEVFLAMAGATATVTPTRSIFPEGRCMTALESISLGTPVIAPRFGPFPYAVRTGSTGVLYEPDDTISLASAMERIAASPFLAQNMRAAAKNSSAASQTTHHSFLKALQIAAERKI